MKEIDEEIITITIDEETITVTERCKVVSYGPSCYSNVPSVSPLDFKRKLQKALRDRKNNNRSIHSSFNILDKE